MQWNKEFALESLKHWINDGEWEGTAHFRKHNSSLYEYLYRTFGMEVAFKKIGLDYETFKKSKGKKIRHRSDKEVLQDLLCWINEGKWINVKDLQVNHQRFYREISRIGFKEAFDQLGLDYRDYRYHLWDENSILKQLKNVIDNDEWEGALHLKMTNPSLYSAINRAMGIPNASQKLGLNYKEYKE